jgi:hypothetical protein
MFSISSCDSLAIRGEDPAADTKDRQHLHLTPAAAAAAADLSPYHQRCVERNNYMSTCRLAAVFLLRSNASKL